MNIQTFSKVSQDHLSNLIFQSHFNLQDKETFRQIREPVELNNNSYYIFYFRYLTGYTLSPNPAPILYTFFIVSPPHAMKQKFLLEIRKKKFGENYDKRIIAGYYLPFTLNNKNFRKLVDNLTVLLSSTLFPNKNYDFIFHLVCPTGDYDFSLIFLETHSVAKYLQSTRNNIH